MVKAGSKMLKLKQNKISIVGWGVLCRLRKFQLIVEVLCKLIVPKHPLFFNFLFVTIFPISPTKIWYSWATRFICPKYSWLPTLFAFQCLGVLFRLRKFLTQTNALCIQQSRPPFRGVCFCVSPPPPWMGYAWHMGSLVKQSGTFFF